MQGASEGGQRASLAPTTVSNSKLQVSQVQPITKATTFNTALLIVGPGEQRDCNLQEIHILGDSSGVHGGY